MEMAQLRYFLAACETLNFTRAAERCHVSQPALNTAIRKLEAELGGALFHRDGKRLLPTELGKAMRPRLERVLGDVAAARDTAEGFQRLRQAPLRLGVMATIGPLRLSQFLGRFRAEQPGIELAVHEGMLAELLTRLGAGELDLALLSSPQPLEPWVSAEPLYRERYVVVVPPGHRFEAMAGVRIEDVANEPYVDRLACEMREMVTAACAAREIPIYAVFRSEREDWAQGMVLAGIGFAFMPEYSVTLAGMVSRPLLDPPVARDIVLARVAGREPGAAARALIAAARRYAKPGAG
jgi:DNA-binding transcriptional LysR family regulator